MNMLWNMLEIVVRNIMERSTQVQKTIYLCSIVHEKAFDKARHEKVIKVLNKYDLG